MQTKNINKKKVSITLSEVEADMAEAVLEQQGFQQLTEFFRYILHKYHDRLLESEKVGENNDKN